MLEVISDTTTTALDRSALVTQRKQTVSGCEGGRDTSVDVKEVVLTWREEGAILVDALVAAVVPEVLEEDEEMALWFIVTTAKSQAIQSTNISF